MEDFNYYWSVCVILFAGATDEDVLDTCTALASFPSLPHFYSSIYNNFLSVFHFHVFMYSCEHKGKVCEWD